jgi:hypothetical protein
MMKLIYLVLFASFGANAAEIYATEDSVLSAVNAYSRSADLQPLDSSGADELRIWTRSYMGGRITGYVISAHRAMKCQTNSSYADGSVTIEPTRCHRIWRWHNNKDAIDALDTLSAMSGKEWDCPMDDGGEIYIDGVRSAKRISLRVGNPNFCDDSESKAVANLLQTLSESR